MKQRLLRRLYEQRIVAIIRGITGEGLDSLVGTLVESGIRIMEVTVDTPGVYDKIQKIKDEYGDEVAVGAGTVLDSETARTAISAGAEFLVSPSLNVDVIKTAKRYGKAVFPGCMTPTEIVQAFEAGADVIKVFPASVVGPRYFRELSGPLGHIPLMPTGGVNLDNALAYVEAGAAAVGLGSALVGRGGRQVDLADVKERAQAFRDLLRTRFG
ncbi:bifunctional 4-hydroxy-2-oxoglutarate aldolase/2-dehydro-3-deoxy-phosphogluconate aldolase [Novibacillus thermophilus]|uniref:2-dehydro-3-deoxyphosphogluconate aldolase n=1 Tax=Novibacillus thermophilus TaxID=1471761 RepID=A0A1U9K455_9BACL|nr:bifunctional 4-hydroxy-2-oxoglutarate aldolase/2-dehydro-3-deoxy-phosphogluconate aldolase [Novibacillus thermophilus]AQS54827.1 2-dehydro-3-deoxyphosphogluconate aldolase [Novibacillus thermophilus]